MDFRFLAGHAVILMLDAQMPPPLSLMFGGSVDTRKGWSSPICLSSRMPMASCDYDT